MSEIRETNIVAEASAEAAVGAAMGGGAVALLGITSLVGSALFPLLGAVAVPVLVNLIWRRTRRPETAASIHGPAPR